MSGMAGQFQPLGDGYIFRFNAKGPPIPVSKAEHDHYVRRFRWVFAGHVLGFMAVVIAGAMLTAHFFPKGNELGGFVLMGAVMLGTLGLIVLSVRWWLAAPARAFADRVKPLG
jgi:hypothetical protein